MVAVHVLLVERDGLILNHFDAGCSGGVRIPIGQRSK